MVEDLEHGDEGAARTFDTAATPPAEHGLGASTPGTATATGTGVDASGAVAGGIGALPEDNRQPRPRGKCVGPDPRASVPVGQR